MIRRPPRSTQGVSSAASDVYKRQVIKEDEKIDKYETLIEQQVVNLIALRQPMAIDLRETVTALKMSSDLERIGAVSYTHLTLPTILLV